MLIKSWEKFLDQLENEMGADCIRRWLRTLKVVRFDAGNLYLEATDPFQVLWFEEHVRPKATEWFVRPGGKPIKIHLASTGMPSSKAKGRKAKAEVLPTANTMAVSFQLMVDELDPLCTFDHFFSTEGNLLAHKILTEIAGCHLGKDQLSHLNAQLAVFNPVYVHGRSGTGKTHLLMATAHVLRERGLRAVYVRAETFTENVVMAIRSGEMKTFRQFYRDCDVLLVDDVHVLARKGATQEELFHTFNALHVVGKQMIFSSSCGPQELQLIEPRLVSRFEWGIVMPLEFLKRVEFLEVLRMKAAALSISLSQHVEEFLYQKFDSHPKALCQALEALILRTHLQSHSGSRQSSWTIDEMQYLLIDLLEDEKKQEVKPEKILQCVAENYGVRIDDLTGRGQTRETVLPRQLAMYFCRQQLKMPFSQIGELFDRDHSTVMSSVRQIEKKLQDVDSTLHATHSLIEKQLRP